MYYDIFCIGHQNWIFADIYKTKENEWRLCFGWNVHSYIIVCDFVDIFNTLEEMKFKSKKEAQDILDQQIYLIKEEVK